MEMIKVVTPFGVGFATSQEDLEKMNMFIEGIKAGIGMMSQAIAPELEDDCPELTGGSEEDYEDDEPKIEQCFFNKRKELIDFIRPYLKNPNWNWEVFNDKRADGRRRIKLYGAVPAAGKLEELREKLIGCHYQAPDGMSYMITDVYVTDPTKGYNRPVSSLALLLES